MGKRGPKKKPTIAQLKKGDPGKRAKKQAKVEPMPPARIDQMHPPKDLAGVALDEWNRIIRILGDMEDRGQRLITEADVTMLAMYCRAHGDYLEARKEIKDKGLYIFGVNKAGGEYYQLAPWVSQMYKAGDVVRRLSAAFGFTPADRASVQLLPQKPGDKKGVIEELIYKKKA